jgi:hypothetical protein
MIQAEKFIWSRVSFGTLKRLGLHIKEDYFKITNLASGKKLVENFKGLKDTIVTWCTTLWICSHAKTEMDVVKELASDDKAYRHSTLILV